MTVGDGKVLWRPSPEAVATARLTDYVRWLGDERGHPVADYASLWRWSVDDLDGFWLSIWDYFAIPGPRPEHALTDQTMPFTRWFEGAQVNYAERLLAYDGGERVALLALDERDGPRPLTWRDLRAQAASVAQTLRELDVGPGDRVAAYLPNIAETVVAFLATASIGAIWSVCPPEFGAPSALDRFRQIDPKILFVADGYRYGGRVRDRRDAVGELRAGLPTVEHVIHVPYPSDLEAAEITGALAWGDVVSRAAEWSPLRVSFDHPLWILYSSGTTGLPKPIVHGHGGVLVEHLKSHGLQLDLGGEDVFFWYSSTGWVMWNLLVAGLAVGSTIVLYDGDPAFPDMTALWRAAEALGVTVFGAGASFYETCMKEDLRPGAQFDLSSVRCLGSTGSPLTVETFQWLHRDVSPDAWVMSFSGGTDVATAFVGGCPILPVRAGELQCRWLGVDAVALDEAGAPADGVGELVIRAPMPSMPLRLLNDPDGRRLRDSYFATYPGQWRHGDWIEFTASGGAVIHGRSDSTINRRGVRMGTAELYRVIDAMPDIADSLVVDLEGLRGASYLAAFVLPAAGVTFDAQLEQRIRTAIRRDLSPRHVPDGIFAVTAIPRTLNGKKLEVPVKRVLLGADPDEVVNPDATREPAALRELARIAPAVRKSAGLTLGS